MAKKYKRRSTDRLVRILEKAEYSLTDCPEEAIYILDDGRMIDGGFDYGCRGIDHRMIFCAYDENPYASKIPFSEWWNRVHKQYRLVRLVPEAKIALIKGRQRLTREQERIIEYLGYELEVY